MSVEISELERLYDVADDYELGVLEGLAIRAGLRWNCPVSSWTNNAGEDCDECGMTWAEYEKYKTLDRDGRKALRLEIEARFEG